MKTFNEFGKCIKVTNNTNSNWEVWRFDENQRCIFYDTNIGKPETYKGRNTE